MAISGEKERYLVTLDKQKTTQLKKVISDLDLPVSVFSSILRDLIELILPVYQEMAKSKLEGRLNLSPLESSLLMDSVIKKMGDMTSAGIEE